MANEELERKIQKRTQALRLKHAQLLQSEKLASLGQLVAGVAHEMNTPLGAIKSTNHTLARSIDRLEQLRDDSDPQVQGQRRRLLEQARQTNQLTAQAADRIDKIVTSLRRFARLDRAAVDQYDLHHGLDDTLNLLEHQLARVAVRRSYDELPSVVCRPDQINQVFMTLVVNSLQAMDQGGELELCTRVCGADQVEVEVRDSGHGIDPDVLPRIFDPGFTTKGVGVGTGLGLAIAHQIVDEHGGYIVVESLPGHGCAFKVRLPVRPQMA